MTLLPLADARADALALWTRSATRTPFSHPAFAEAVGAAFGLTPLAVLSDQTGVIGLEKTRGPLRALALPPLAPEAPPLLTAHATEAAAHSGETPLATLVSTLADRFDQAAFALGPWPDARPFAWAGWNVATRYTYALDVSPEAPDRWSKTTRWEARRHADAYIVEWGDAPLARAADLEVAAYDRKDADLGISPEAIADVARALADAGLARAVGARNRETGALDAAAVFAVDSDRAWYWIAGSVPGPAMTVLLDRAVRDLASGGVAHLDWAGANVPSVAEFKRKRADRLVPTLTVRHVGPRWLRAAHALR
ncbi:MAG: hypothetical protein AAFQ43_03880 [Bacteroidota bacterium]